MIPTILTKEFTTGSLLHISALIVSLLIVFFTWQKCRGIRSNPHTRFRRFIAIGCLIVWLINTVYYLMPVRFIWSQALPLYICNIANLIGAIAVWKSSRAFQSVLYFWTFALCTWAFLTPSLRGGLDTLEFWNFWAYHVMIFVSVTFVLVADEFRPGWKDFRLALLVTLSYLAVLAVVDRITGWNYGFVGPGKPEQATVIDSLGHYPIRLLWMGLIGAALFALLMLPFVFRGKKEKTD